MFYVGLDQHWKTSTACILDSHGREVNIFTVRGHWSKMIERLHHVAASTNQKLAICYEASCGYGALYERLAKVADRITVAHPGQLRLIFRSKKKNDRIDARKLAKLLFLGEVPPVHVPDAEVRSWRSLIEFRRRTMDKRTRVKNSLRALLKSYGIVKPKEIRTLWSKAGRAWLGSLTWPGEQAQLQCEMLLEELDQVDGRVKKVTRQLDRYARRQPGVALLRTIPGVGPRTAEAVAAYIDKPQRFARNKQVGDYFGLVPCQDASATVNRLGHITKQGPPTARKLLIEAAWQGIRRDARLRAYFERISGGKQDRRKIALVATAHYLVRIMLSMLKSGEVWRGGAPESESAARAA